MSSLRTLVVLQSTSFCNIDCSYCYLPNRSINKKMDLVLVEQIAKEVFSSELVTDPIDFLWHAGEPLALPPSYYEEAISIVHRIGKDTGTNYSFNFQTNATLVSEKWTKFFRKHKVNIGVSLGGPAFIHDRNRVDRKKNGTHSDAMEGIRILQAAGIRFSAIMVVTKHSLDYADEICDFFIGHNITDIGFNIDEMEGTHESTSFAEVDVEKYRKFIKRLLKRSLDSNGTFRVRELWVNLKLFTSDHDFHKTFNTTNTPFKIFNFSCEGNYSTFCPELLAAKSEEYNNFFMGNIMTDGLDSIKANHVFQAVNSQIQSGVELCKQTCDYWSFCGGGAPSNKFFENGSFESTNTIMCKFLKKEIVDMLIEHFEEKIALCSSDAF